MTDSSTTADTTGAQNGVWQPSPLLVAGPQIAALRPFLFDCVWEGRVAAGGMGPGSPEMTAVGKATFTPILDGIWIACDCEQDQFLSGGKVITWKAHFVAGWDPQSDAYRLAYVDSNGSASLMHGRIEGDSLIFDTLGTDPMQLRLTWTPLGDGTVTWRNECSIADGEWFLIEEYRCTPA